ncbi:hypothetical protein Sjap_017937 [Stephania japonica]|uniref:Dihydrolipoamide acetyltransferase component of pyruvate dehydrogenase complex n=1 Tax=Stephania japonica TaxID=461633 RepID=A0AAP0I728_9MAGN
MVDLEGQDHGPSSSSVGDNDDDFIVYSKEGNNARWFKKEGDEVSAEDIFCEVETDNATVAMECTEEVFLAKIIHGDGAKVIKVGEVPLSKIKGTGSDGTIVRADNEDYLGTSILLLSTSIVRYYALTQIVKGCVVNAPALALCKVPQCNSLWTDEYIRQYHSVNVAVQTEHGLFVPVVRDADKKGLSKIADEVKSFKQKAKENSLKPEDYEALSLCQILEELMGSSNSAPSSIPHNLEYLPSDQVIKVEKRVVPGAGPDQYTFASYLSVTLSCDHRVIDGA